MTPRTPFVSMEEAMQDTGLTKRMIAFDVKNGYLPGKLDHRGIIRIRRNEWDAYLAGDWQPVQEEPVKSKPGIVSIQRKAS